MVIIIILMSILIVFCSIFWLFDVLKTTNTEGLESMTQSLHIYPNTYEERKNVTKNLPEILKNELDNLILYKKFGISKWGVDPNSQQLIIYAYDIQDQNEINNLQNKKIGNWTIRIVHDTGIENEIKEVYTELKQMETDSDLQVSGCEMLPADRKIRMGVYKSTSDNQKLNDTVIKGWTVEVYLAGRPPIPPTLPRKT